jgi:hypothetical protein
VVAGQKLQAALPTLNLLPGRMTNQSATPQGVYWSVWHTDEVQLNCAERWFQYCELPLEIYLIERNTNIFLLFDTFLSALFSGLPLFAFAIF